MLNVKKMLTKLAERFVVETYSYGNFSISAGVRGTLALYPSVSIAKTGYTAKMVSVTSMGHGSAYFVVPTTNGTNMTIQIYRVTENAVTYSSPNEIQFAVLYEKA